MTRRHPRQKWPEEELIGRDWPSAQDIAQLVEDLMSEDGDKDVAVLECQCLQVLDARTCTPVYNVQCLYRVDDTASKVLCFRVSLTHERIWWKFEQVIHFLRDLIKIRSGVVIEDYRFDAPLPEPEVI